MGEYEEDVEVVELVKLKDSEYAKELHLNQCRHATTSCFACQYWGPPGCRKGILMDFLRENYPEEDLVIEELSNNYRPDQRIVPPKNVVLKWVGEYEEDVEVVELCGKKNITK